MNKNKAEQAFRDAKENKSSVSFTTDQNHKNKHCI